MRRHFRHHAFQNDRARTRRLQSLSINHELISAIGSANLDNRSFRLNFEVMLLTVDEAFASEVEHMLLDDFAQAHETSQEESQQTRRLQQLGMRVARLISPIL